MTGSALIGHTGLVGSNLRAQREFDRCFNSSNFTEMTSLDFSTVVCAGVSAVKWWANQNPDTDWERIAALIEVLRTTTARHFILISTVDVYQHPVGVYEDDEIQTDGLHAYGVNRHRLERFTREHFARTTIVRLPALFGDGLKKNAIFDLLHDNRVETINPAGCFQWYPLDRLGADLDRLTVNEIALANLATEPVTMQTIVDAFFPEVVIGRNSAGPAGRYDMRTRHDALFGGANGYIADAPEVMSAIRAFIARVRSQ